MPKIDGVECPNAPYICRWSYGSPAQKYGLRGMHWIIEVNGLPTRDLDEFLTVSIRDSAILRLSLFGILATSQPLEVSCGTTRIPRLVTCVLVCTLPVEVVSGLPFVDALWRGSLLSGA